ncbi:MAG: NAD(P)H-dependent glycerol-3-phosphate dehydrogenase, partial [Rhodobacteraceae bacterium]|nr:NAD(P)H-dependent glycerol-3-phosphate dehydrogenase [Paracoccaceae bacterium]
SWGTSVASLVARNAPVTLWARDGATVDEINAHSTNSRYLGALKLTPTLRATHDMEQAVSDADVVVLGVPSQAMRETAAAIRPMIRPWVPVISLAKGFELSTGKRMSEVIGEELEGHPVGALTGPNLAREIVQGMAAAAVIAMEDEVIARELQALFRTGMFRVYTNSDVVGAELGGALKNIYAIAAGMGDGLGAGVNTRSALLTRSMAEMIRLGCALGARADTLMGLAGMGDLLTTATSEQSRNRTVGFKLGQGMALDAIIAEMNQVAEGVKATGAVWQMACERGIDLPIVQEVRGVVHEGRSAREAFAGLVRIAPRSEADPG